MSDFIWLIPLVAIPALAALPFIAFDHIRQKRAVRRVWAYPKRSRKGQKNRVTGSLES